MARVRVKQLSRVQATLRNKLSRTNAITREILREGADDIAELAGHLVREQSGQLRKAIQVDEVRDSKNRLTMVVNVNMNTKAAYKRKDGTLVYRNFNVRRYAEKMNTGGYKWGEYSKTKNKYYGGFAGVRKDRGKYVGDHFIARAKEFYHPIIIRKMKTAIDEVL
jgi:Bacteriophage protein of unknown function (DUF646).